MGDISVDLSENIPGDHSDRKTPRGELHWIFTAVTDTIAWNTLPSNIFQKLFREDLLAASLFRFDLRVCHYVCKCHISYQMIMLHHVVFVYCTTQVRDTVVSFSVIFVVNFFNICFHYRNFLLAKRLMKSLNCTAQSWPPLPDSSTHQLWQTWDLAAESCLFHISFLQRGAPMIGDLSLI